MAEAHSFLRIPWHWAQFFSSGWRRQPSSWHDWAALRPIGLTLVQGQDGFRVCPNVVDRLSTLQKQVSRGYNEDSLTEDVTAFHTLFSCPWLPRACAWLLLVTEHLLSAALWYEIRVSPSWLPDNSTVLQPHHRQPQGLSNGMASRVSQSVLDWLLSLRSGQRRIWGVMGAPLKVHVLVSSVSQV